MVSELEKQFDEAHKEGEDDGFGCPYFFEQEKCDEKVTEEIYNKFCLDKYQDCHAINSYNKVKLMEKILQGVENDINKRKGFEEIKKLWIYYY